MQKESGSQLGVPQEEYEDLSESRFLFEQVMIDDEPTELEIQEQAEELQIDDLELVRDSLVREMEPFWRPYCNRYGDIYYINLRQRKAYVDHPIDMETKLDFYHKKRQQEALKEDDDSSKSSKGSPSITKGESLRLKLRLEPRFESFELQEIAHSLNLVYEEIAKWERGELDRPTSKDQKPVDRSNQHRSQSFINTSELNIVYEESDEDESQRRRNGSENSLQDASSDEDSSYIENLEISARSRREAQKDLRDNLSNLNPKGDQFVMLNKRSKKFPAITEDQHDEDSLEAQGSPFEDVELSMDQEKQLIDLERKTFQLHKLELENYRRHRDEILSEKSSLLKQKLRYQHEVYKEQKIKQYQAEVENKNQNQFEKEKLKLERENRQKLNEFQDLLHSDYALEKDLQKIRRSKAQFLEDLKSKQSVRIKYKKSSTSHQMCEQMKRNWNQKVAEVSNEHYERFKQDLRRQIENSIKKSPEIERAIVDSLQAGVRVDSYQSQSTPKIFCFKEFYEKQFKQEMLNLNNAIELNRLEMNARKIQQKENQDPNRVNNKNSRFKNVYSHITYGSLQQGKREQKQSENKVGEEKFNLDKSYYRKRAKIFTKHDPALITESSISEEFAVQRQSASLQNRIEYFQEKKKRIKDTFSKGMDMQFKLLNTNNLNPVFYRLRNRLL